MIQLLYYEDENLSIEARYFLWQWAHHIGFNNFWSDTSLSLYETLFLSPYKAKKAISNLKKTGILEVKSQHTGERGRPAYIYSIAPSFQQALAYLPSTLPILSSYLQYVMTNMVSTSAPCSIPLVDSHPYSKKERARAQAHARKNQLTMANGWALAVLLVHADNAGIVNTLGEKRLRALTGLTSSGLNSQRKKLIDRGVIARYVPGSAKKRQGTRLTSVYLLNLSHPDVVAPKGNDVCITMPAILSKQGDRSLCGYQVRALFEAASLIKKKNPDRQSNTFNKYHDFGVPLYCYDDSFWDVINALPRDVNCIIQLLRSVHQAAMAYLNAKVRTSPDVYQQILASPMEATWQDQNALMSLVDDAQHNTLMAALKELAVHLADRLYNLLTGGYMAKIDMTIPRTYELFPVSEAPHPGAGSSKRLPCWQLLGTPSDPERCRDVLAGNVEVLEKRLVC